MTALLARAIQIAGLAVFCACGIAVMQFFSRADDAQPKAADLTHLQFTATDHLSAKIVTPRDGDSVSGIAVQVSAVTVKGAGIELSVNGDVVPARNIGRMTVTKDGRAQFDFFGVLLRPGPNTIVATALGANGTRGESATETVWGPGPAESIRVELLGSLVADGRSTARLLVTAFDRWNHPAMPGSEVHVAIVEGKARVGEAEGGIELSASPNPRAGDLATPQGVDASSQPAEHFGLGEGGRVAIPLTASLEPGALIVKINIGDISDTENFRIAPFLRKPFVNGLISVGAGSVPAAVDGDGRYDGGGARDGRIAVYGSGKVGKGSSLTVSYESQNRLDQSSSYGPYVADPDERPYQTYGDSSIVSSDFHSLDRLYARIDNGRNNAMWGQYDTVVGDPQGVAHYEQQLSGFKGEIGLGATGQGHVMAFTARNPTAFVSETLPITGLATLLQPLRPDIVIGSDYLTLVSLDRRTGLPATQTPLTRNIDYTIDYATGVVRFLNIPLPFDVHFNPQVLYVQYQYQGPGVNSETSGGDLRYAFSRSNPTVFDLGYLNDTTGSANYSLTTASLSGQLPAGLWRLSHAMSNGLVPNAGASNLGVQTGGAGAATQFQFDEHFRGNQVAVDYSDIGAGFANPFGGFTTNGSELLDATFAHQGRNRGNFLLSFTQQRNTAVGNESLQQTMTAQWQAIVNKALQFSLGLQAQRQSNGPGAIGSTQNSVTGSNAQAQMALQWRPMNRTNVSFQHSASLGGNDQVLPSQTTAEIDYDFPKAGRVYLRELYGGAVQSFADSTQQYTAPSISSHSTQIGLQRTVGPNTSVDSSYLISDTGNATSIYTTLGVEENFKFGKRLAGNASYQSAQSMGASAANGFSVFGTGLTYTDLKDFRASLAYQTRGGFGGGSTFSGGATGHMGPNIALLGTFNETFGAGSSAVDDRVSMAYRPDQSDRLISLAGLDRESGGLFGGSGTADVLSFEEVFRPTADTEITGRFGYKLNGDGYYLAHSSVAGLRITQNLGTRFDIGAEAREMAAGNIPGARATDFATELGYKAPGGMRIAGGYNFSGSVDPTLTGHPVRKGFYVTVTTLIDRIFGWGKP